MVYFNQVLLIRKIRKLICILVFGSCINVRAYAESQIFCAF